ncbi:MAG TPA: hypothetical protein VFE86_06870, partial [Ilumatobacteraceae bacterium]|nr:hypothetical protein [Ilumatobacteraceae bacterium]
MIGRRMVAAGVVVAAVTVGAVAGALIGVPGLSGASGSPNVVPAASDSTTTTTPGSDHDGRGRRGGARFGAGKGVLDAAAKALNLSTEDLLKKLSDGKTTIADVAQAQNVDLATVTDAMEAVAKSEIQDLVTKPFPQRPDFGGKHRGGRGFGPGMGGPGLGGGMAFGFGGELRGSIDALAKSLGISTEDLMKDIAGGQTIADIAKSKNVDINTVIDGLVNDATAKIDAAAKAGQLDQDRATALKSKLRDKITKAVNKTHLDGGGRFG